MKPYRVFICSFALAATSGRGSAGGEDVAPPQLVPISLRNLRWQPLPDRVVGVYSEPGGRPWLRVEPTRQLSIEQIKALVERTLP